MNKTKSRTTKMPVLTALAIFGLIAGIGIVAAYSWGAGHGLSQEDKNAMYGAIENNDYPSWRALMTSQLTEENFNKMTERHKAMQEKRAAINSAFESEDYGAWVAAMTSGGREPRMLQFVTEENFPTLVELHKARQAGDSEQVQALQEHLGFPHVPGQNFDCHARFQ